VKRSIFKISILLSILFSINITSSAQSFHITHYTREEGLPNELIKAIATDKFGQIWMATDEGIISYNGLQFNQITDNLPSTYIKSISKDGMGNIWVASDMGIIQVTPNPVEPEIKLLLAGESKANDSALWFPKHFYADSQKRLWFSDNNAIWKYENGVFKKYKQEANNLTMSWQRSFSFTENQNGSLYAISQTGNLFVYNANTDSFDKILQNDKPSIVSHVYSMDNNILLVATANGVLMYTLAGTNEIRSVKNLTPGIDAAYIEPKGVNEYWIGTWTQGLYILSEQAGTSELKRIEEYTTNIACYLSTDQNGDLWVASDNGLWLLQQNTCEAPFAQQSNIYTQHIYQKSETELYFTDGENIFLVNPTKPFLPAQKIISNAGRYFLALTHVNHQLWAADASGKISVIENNKITQTIDLTAQGGAIYYLFTDKQNNVWLSQDRLNGVARVDKNLGVKVFTESEGVGSHISAMAISSEGKIYAGGTKNGDYLYEYDPTSERFINLSFDFDTTQPRDIIVHQMTIGAGALWLATSYGLVTYKDNKIEPVNTGFSKVDAAKAICTDRNNQIWFANSQGVYKIVGTELFFYDEISGLPSKTIAFRCMTTDAFGRVWIGTTSGPAFFPNKTKPAQTPTPYLLYVQNNDRYISPEENSFLNTSYFKFKFTNSIFPTKYLQYEWRLKGKDDKWQKLESLDGLYISDLSPKNYALEVRCRKFGHYTWSEPLIFEFSTHRAWYLTWWSFVFFVGLLSVGVWAIVKYNTQRLENQKKNLEHIVKERTHEVILQQKEILEKNEELNQTNEELMTTLDLVRDQKTQIEHSHKNITDSIQSALKIQEAMLPPGEILQRNFKEYFMLYKPRNIVSGDFYWFRAVKNYTYLVAADCTGHGVPGAFMSMLGISLLNEVITEHSTLTPAQILNELRERTKKSLNQDAKPRTTQDGMDMSLCRVNNQTGELIYAGANNTFYLTRKQVDGSYTLIETRGDRMPIGIYPKDNESFNDFSMRLSPSDTFYIFTDGYVSQFGSKTFEKFKTKRLKEKLLAIQHLSLSEQKNELIHTFEEWKGENSQVDDILILGVKVE